MKLTKFIALSLCTFVALYLVWPVPGFPPPPPGSLVSSAPADTESIYRKAYYTNYSRSEIINYYKSQFKWPFIRLNHPPEESQTLIRDQTQTSWLEELVHPLKDSLYINGFYPTKPTEQINFGPVHYQAKIIAHYLPSHTVTRLTVLLMSVTSVYLLLKEYAKI